MLRLRVINMYTATGAEVVFRNNLFRKCLHNNVLFKCNYQTNCKQMKTYSFVRGKIVTQKFNNPLICRNILRPVSSSCNEGKTLVKNDIDSECQATELIIFNTRKQYIINTAKIKSAREKKKKWDDNPLPVFLKYMTSDEDETESSLSDSFSSSENNKITSLENSGPINFPYSLKISADDQRITSEENICEATVINSLSDETSTYASNHFASSQFSKFGKRWMNDYEKYTENDEEGELEEWHLDYGTADPNRPVSNVPCGGCGAFLHCQDPAIPGYLPSEIFAHCRNRDLLSITCQRCHFMKYYNTALGVNVDQDLYPKLLARIKDQNALILLMVDVTDFPCSIWPGILDILGKKRPLFIVGNKVDLLWGDCKSWLDNVAKLLRASFPLNANIKHVSLVSAKTGFGVEELINKLHNIWQYKGDVYLLGCTNVGKSTLFNALLQSDYCKVKAVDLLQRATTSPWPGTTLNLLKFPILRPEGWRLYLRTMRLINDRKKHNYEEKMRQQLMKMSKTKAVTPPQLIGHIGRTFSKKPAQNEVEAKDNFAVPNRKQLYNALIDGSGLDPNDPDFVKSRWFYDTPGVLHNDQILDLLTTEELMLTLPKEIIEPRTFLIKPEWSVFIAGLARLDYIEGSEPIRLTVFSSSALPVTICEINNAERIYTDLVGTEYMLVPTGSEQRLKQWPNLQSTQKVSLIGTNSLVSCGDIILSSAGWISVTAAVNQICKFVPWTPLGRGVHVRTPSLLPNAVNLRGEKIRRSPAYRKSKPFSGQ